MPSLPTNHSYSHPFPGPGGGWEQGSAKVTGEAWGEAQPGVRPSALTEGLSLPSSGLSLPHSRVAQGLINARAQVNLS